MSVHTFPRMRPLPPDDERATWCRRCDMLVAVGLTPILHVNACARCTKPAGDRSELGAWLAIAAVIVLLLFAVGALEPVEPPGERAYAEDPL